MKGTIPFCLSLASEKGHKQEQNKNPIKSTNDIGHTGESNHKMKLSIKEHSNKLLCGIKDKKKETVDDRILWA